MGQISEAILAYRHAERGTYLNSTTIAQQSAASQALDDAFDRLIAASQTPNEEWDDADRRSWFIYMEHSQRMVRRLLAAIGNNNGVINPPVAIHLQDCFLEPHNGVLRRISVETKLMEVHADAESFRIAGFSNGQQLFVGEIPFRIVTCVWKTAEGEPAVILSHRVVVSDRTLQFQPA